MPEQDPSSWMWARAREMLERMDRLQRQFFDLRLSRCHRPTWEPPIDIFESPDRLWIVAALPGVEPETLEIAFEGGCLRIGGERFLPAPFRRAQVHRMEIPHGRFERRIDLPAGSFELRDRQLVHGCLFLSLERSEPHG